MVKPNVRFIKLLLQNIKPSKGDRWNWRWRSGARRRHFNEYVSYQNFLIGLSMYFHLINVINTKSFGNSKWLVFLTVLDLYYPDHSSKIFNHCISFISTWCHHWKSQFIDLIRQVLVFTNISLVKTRVQGGLFVIKFSHSGGTWRQPFVFWYCHLLAKGKANASYMWKSVMWIDDVFPC